MRIFEIILKLVFLVGSVYFIWTGGIGSPWFVEYLILGALLGVVLIFNKKSPSYKYAHTPKMYMIRRIEGCLLLLFPVILWYL